MQPFDPIPTEADQLKALVQTTLLQKLPVIDYFFTKVRNEVCGFEVVYFVLADCFTCQHHLYSESLQPAIGSLALVITYALSDHAGQPNTASVSEDMFHSPIDALLRVPLATIHKSVPQQLPIDIDRNRTDEYVLVLLIIMTRLYFMFKGVDHESRLPPGFPPLAKRYPYILG
jgi:hypothetical protein